MGEMTVSGTLEVSGTAVFNEQSKSTSDFRVETDHATHAFFVDGGEDTVGIMNSAPKVVLDVHQSFEGIRDLSAETGGGEVVFFGSGSLTTGKLYYLNSSDTWTPARANNNSTGAKGLLGIALGSNPATNGMLLRGWFHADDFVWYPTVGASLFISTGSAGEMSTSTPETENHIERGVGYVGPLDYLIYFNPDVGYQTIYGE